MGFIHNNGCRTTWRAEPDGLNGGEEMWLISPNKFKGFTGLGGLADGLPMSNYYSCFLWRFSIRYECFASSMQYEVKAHG